MGTKATPQTERLTCPPDHKHQKTCYLEHGCRCNNCREYVRIQREYYRKQKAYGRPTTDLVDAAPVRKHVNQLRAAGMGQDRIAALSGVNRSIIRHLLYGTGEEPPARRIRSWNADALLKVQPHPDDLLLRDPRGTQRRLQALAVNGWSFARISRMLGITDAGVRAYLDSFAVTQETHEKIAELFDQLWNTTPPMESKGDRISAAQTKTWARRNNWVPALAWDDIDDDEKPHSNGRVNWQARSVEERAARVAELHFLRWSDHRIAVELGIADRTVIRIRQRLGLPGWTKEQQEAAA